MRSLLTLSSQSTPNSDLRMCMHESPLSRPKGGRFSRRRETSRVCFDEKRNAQYILIAEGAVVKQGQTK